MKPLRPMLFFVSLLLIVGMACRFGSPAPTEAPPPTQPVQVIPTDAPPEPTEVPPTEAPATEPPATEPPAPQAQQFFTENSIPHCPVTGIYLRSQTPTRQIWIK